VADGRCRRHRFSFGRLAACSKQQAHAEQGNRRRVHGDPLSASVSSSKIDHGRKNRDCQYEYQPFEIVSSEKTREMQDQYSDCDNVIEDEPHQPESPQVSFAGVGRLPFDMAQ
jgi:hypothetical protein